MRTGVLAGNGTSNDALIAGECRNWLGEKGSGLRGVTPSDSSAMPPAPAPVAAAAAFASMPALPLPPCWAAAPAAASDLYVYVGVDGRNRAERRKNELQIIGDKKT